MANKGAKTLSAGKFSVPAGGSGKMHGFTPVGKQAPDNTAVKGSGGSKKWSKPDTGGSGKMKKFEAVQKVKPGITSVK